MTLRHTVLGVLVLAVPATHAAEQLRFATCPVFRDVDAGRKSGCWLVEDPATGIRYDVTPSPTKPDWNHEALVEGVVSGRQDNACGGVVLDPVRVSILPGGCTRHSLPAEGFKGRPFVLPARNVRPLSEARAAPPQPWTDRVFSLQYEWDRSFGVYQLDDYLLDQAWTPLGRACRQPAGAVARQRPTVTDRRRRWPD